MRLYSEFCCTSHTLSGRCDGLRLCNFTQKVTIIPESYVFVLFVCTYIVADCVFCIVMSEDIKLTMLFQLGNIYVRYSIRIIYKLETAVFMFCLSVAGSFMKLICLITYGIANRAMIEGVFKDVLSKYCTTVTFNFEVREIRGSKQESRGC
jgi:hypothetical protein